jgi:glycosyltransferase involved in cell wall biosynthesis
MPDVIGGIEAHCQQLYPRIVKQSDCTRVTLLIRHGYIARRRFAFEGIDIRTIWSPYVWGVDTVVHSFLSVIYARLVLRADLVHLHGIGPGFFAPLARLLGLKTVVTHHARDYLRPKWTGPGRLFLKSGERLTALAAERIICVSKALRDEFTSAFPGAAVRTRVIPNASAVSFATQTKGIDVLKSLGLEENGYIVAVGRLDAAKAFDDLIAAYHATSTPMKLVIVGSEVGNEAHAADLWRHRSDRIIFAGFQTGDALAALYRNAALFVHPSKLEGYGLVIAEALAADRPLIVSDIGPHLEFELPPQCYFPAGDIDALAVRLAASSYAQYKAPVAATALATLSWDEIARRHLALYDELLGAVPPLRSPTTSDQQPSRLRSQSPDAELSIGSAQQDRARR